MQLMPSLSVKQKQSLVMTPQLQQAIKLLQMTNLDIQSFLEEQALENPFLEVEAAKSDSDTSGPDITSPDISGPDGLADGLADGLSGAPADLSDSMRDGAALGDDPTAHSDVENRFESNGLDLGRSAGSTTPSPDTDWDSLANMVPDQPQTLHEFIVNQIDLSIFDPQQRFIAYEFTDALEPTGWLSQSVEDIAERCGCSNDDADEVLSILQRFEPEGVFARDLAECLRIQAREQDLLIGPMQIVLDNLEILGRGDLQVLARRAKCDISDIADCLKQIREFNPKPGEAFDAAPLRLGAPDVIVSRGADGWVVDLNRSTLPSLVINEDYASAVNAASRRNKSEEAKSYANEALGSARWLRRALEQRNSTTLKISGEVVARQAEFLTHGLSALKPLSLKNVAEAVGMHESTVSRVTSGLMIATPKGSFPMKSLFSVSIAASDDGDNKAAGAVRDMIKSIVDAEPAGQPLSDDAIAAMVSEKGVKLARRTVAKYRDMLRIPSSSERRRRARLNMAS
jgi:RNA polymerase sigma-54 factor